jgi:hypothetical protein
MTSFNSQITSISSSIKNDYFEKGKVYVTTNELDEDVTIEALKTISSVGNLLIGVSGFCCLDLAATRKVDYVLIVDPSSLTELFWKQVTPLITDSQSRSDCIIKLQTHLKANINNYSSETTSEETIADDLENYNFAIRQYPSWLATDAGYEHIKNVFKKGNFAFVKMDIIDTETCKKLKQVFENFSLKLDTIYLSNVHNFIRIQDYPKYAQSLELLLSDNTIIVDTQDEPFKLTPELSRINCRFPLQRCIRTPVNLKLAKFQNPVQRVMQRTNEPIEMLYPIIHLQKSGTKEDQLFYEYGLLKKYYTAEEADVVAEKVKAKLTANNIPCTDENVSALAYPLLYSKS